MHYDEILIGHFKKWLKISQWPAVILHSVYVRYKNRSLIQTFMVLFSAIRVLHPPEGVPFPLAFSFSVPRSFESTLFLRVPGPWAVGREEWKTKRRPLRPAAFNASIPALTTGSRMT